MKLAILDKDGTLVTSTNPSGFVSLPEEQVIKEGSLELVERLLELNYSLVVVSNQGGVQYNHKTLETVFNETLYCNKLFWEALERPVFNAFYFCPDYKGESCWKCEPWRGSATYNRNSWRFQPHDLKGGMLEQEIGTAGTYRKPGGGMLRIALKEAVSLEDYVEDSLMIGDRSEDLLAAQSVKVKFAHIDEALGWLNRKYPKES